MEKKQFTVDVVDRLDVFLSKQVDKTRSAIKKLIDEGNVTVNGKKVKAGENLRIGDVIDLTLPDLKPLDLTPVDLPIDVVYENGDFAVINKPQGLTVHAGSGTNGPTLVNALLYRLDSLSGINGVVRPGIVHRIDKDTSGLLVVAKNDFAHLNLSEQIKNKTCHRIYIALLSGVLKADSGRIDTYIGRSDKVRTMMAVKPEGEGRRAITDYTVVKRYREYTLCRFELYTGRTHQIRVHCKHIGHPIVGDKTYGKEDKFGLKGQLLHAGTLVVTDPRSGEEMTFNAPIPTYFQDVINKLDNKKK